MLYPDFSPNRSGMQPLGQVQPNFEFIDVDDYKTKFSKKKSGGVKNYVTRIPALNQTDYFENR